MTGTLRVTPEKLISTAQSFSSSAGTVQNLTSSMLSTIDNLNSTWAGEAATAYYNKAHGLQESINKMIRMINEHSTDLQAMAQTYQDAERTAQETAAALQTDVIA
jgi:WXG100 family type VII secretion target